MRTAVLVVLLFALGEAAFAAHPSFGRGLITNLDGDPARETVSARNNVSFDHKYARGTIFASDNCGGQRRSYELSPPSSVNSWLVLNGIQGSKALGRPGVLFVIRYSGEAFIARVTRLQRSPKETCPVPVNLFEYSTESPPRPPPRDNVIVDVSLAAGEHARAPGRELRLTERYAKSSSGPITELRRTYFRYVRLQRRYVEYRSVLFPAP